MFMGDSCGHQNGCKCKGSTEGNMAAKAEPGLNHCTRHDELCLLQHGCWAQSCFLWLILWSAGNCGRGGDSFSHPMGTETSDVPLLLSTMHCAVIAGSRFIVCQHPSHPLPACYCQLPHILTNLVGVSNECVLVFCHLSLQRSSSVVACFDAG